MNVRVAFRHEGEKVNVYLAMVDTMEDAVFISSIAVDLVKNPITWQDYKDFILHTMERHGIGGTRWEEEIAPEHERAGRG